MIKIVKYLFLLLFFLVGCNDSDLSEYEQSNKKVEVYINGVSSSSTTKTTIGDDLASTSWAIDDEILVWAKGVGASSYTLSAKPFVLRNYGTSFSSATFTTDITEMEEGTYTYYGVYPTPTSISNTTVSYNISSTQNGKYDGVNDIMVATPTESRELTSTISGSPDLEFNHLTHMIRIEIPDGRNEFGLDLTGIDVTFPSNVTGNISFDATSEDVSTTISSGGGKVVSVVFDEPFVTGDENYIWMFVNPTYIGGAVEFVAYGEGGNASDKIGTYMYKTLEAGRVTPITLTLPIPKVQTILNVEISSADMLTRIGEPLESVTFTLPSGVYFDDGTSSVTMDAQSDSDIYSVYLLDVSEEYEALLKSGSLGVQIETASVEKTLTGISLSGITIDTTNELEAEVPYFFYSDFSEITASGSGGTSESNTTNVVAISGLSDWWGGQRSQWDTGYIKIRPYTFWWGQYESRITSCTMSDWGLKAGASVALKIVCKVVWYKNKSDSVNLIIGTTTTTELEGGFVKSTSTGLTNGNNSYVQTITVTNCTATSSSYRIAWESDASGTSLGYYDQVTINEMTVTIVQ